MAPSAGNGKSDGQPRITASHQVNAKDACIDRVQGIANRELKKGVRNCTDRECIVGARPCENVGAIAG